MNRLTEHQRHGDGEQGHPSGALERPDQVPVAPQGLVERERPHADDHNRENRPMEKRQVTGSGEALGQISEGLDGVRAGLNPVVGRNLGHLLGNLLITTGIAALLMVGPGLPGLTAFVESYAAVAVFVAVFVAAPWAICEASMNAWRKSRNLPPQELFLSRDVVTDFEAVLPHFRTARAIFTIVALAFFAASAASADGGFGEAFALMVAVSAVCTLFADAIPLLIIVRHRKEIAQ